MQNETAPIGPATLANPEAAAEQEVAAAMELLAGADGVPLEEQPALFDAVHRRLQDVLDADAP